MSTRATYKFVPASNERFRPTVCFYIHHDGYPAGAAHYFQNALNLDPNDVGCNAYGAERFIRGNSQAEFTPDHDSHGDTQYRYTVTGKEMTMDVRTSGPQKWVQKWKGTVEEFIAFAQA